jgi:hypothetical protein
LGVQISVLAKVASNSVADLILCVKSENKNRKFGEKSHEIMVRKIRKVVIEEWLAVSSS